MGMTGGGHIARPSVPSSLTCALVMPTMLPDSQLVLSTLASPCTISKELCHVTLSHPAPRG